MRAAGSSGTTRSSITTPIFCCAPNRTATRSPMRASIASGSEYSNSVGNGTSRATRTQEFFLSGKDLEFVDKDVGKRFIRSEEHTSELQSRRDLVCRLLL